MLKCPQCKSTINSSQLKTEESFLYGTKNTIVVSCPHCDAILGFIPESR
jgi:phage FluMu protein Com